MTAARIDPNVLRPTGEDGSAASHGEFDDEVIAAINAHADDIDSGAGSAIPASRTITAGTGLSGGGDLSADRTISLANTAVAAGSYSRALVTIDAQGRITSAAGRVFDVKNPVYGATGDGSTDDRVGIQAALDAAVSAGGGIVYFPEGTYSVSRFGVNAYSLTLPSTAANITLAGVRGKSWLKHPTGMPNASVAILYLDRCIDCSISGLGFDGNWGNAVTNITDASSNAALPQATLNVRDTTGFPTSGTITVLSTAGAQSVTYTGKTSTTFTGCSGGTGTVMRNYKVGSLNSNTGINHTTQADPKNYLVFARGTENLIIENSKFKQAYGDFIWFGTSNIDHQRFTRNCRVVNCDGDISARNGVTFGGAVIGAVVDNCRFTNVFAQAVDGEPGGYPIWDVRISKSHLGGWFDISRGNGSAPLSIVGADNGNGAALSGGAAWGWRVRDCFIEGTTFIEYAGNVLMDGNRIMQDFSGTGRPAILCQLGGTGISLLNNTIYGRCSPTDSSEGSAAMGAITAYNYADGSKNYNPSSVRIAGNRIRVRNGRHGVSLTVPGGAVQTFSGTSTTVTGTTLIRSGSGWTTDVYGGAIARIGSAFAMIESNTTDTLTLRIVDTSVSSAWQTDAGEYAPTPTTGAFEIFRTAGVVEVEGNEIDCMDDGNGAGLHGVHVTTAGSPALQGQRVRVHRNTIKGATNEGVYVKWNAGSTFAHVEITDNFGIDARATTTMTAVVGYNGTPNATKWIMRGNVKGEGVTNVVSGLSAGTWLEEDGTVQRWAGYGSPESVVAAPVGSLYHRVDGSAGTVEYIKNSGTGNTGWVPVGGVVATGSITCIAKASLIDGETVTIGDGLRAAVVYEFDTGGGVTAGSVQVDISTDTTAAQVAARLKTAIDANQPAIAVTDPGTGVLTLAHKFAGTAGNVTITETVADAGFLVSGMSGGVAPAR